LLQLAQALGQQPVREAGNRPGQLPKSQRSLGQCRDNRPGPALADQLDRGVKVRADALGAGASLILGRGNGLHRSQLSLVNVSDGSWDSDIPSPQLAQGPVSTGAVVSPRASSTMSSGTAKPPGGPVVVAAKTVPRTRPRLSTSGPPELPLRTLPRSEAIVR